MKKIIFALLLALFVNGSESFAQKAEAPKQKKHACHDDTKKFCAEVVPGKGAIGKCLKSHEKELSIECRKFLKEFKDKKKNKKNSKNIKSQDLDLEDTSSQISEECKGVKFNDPNFKECMKERMEKSKQKWKSFKEKKFPKKSQK